MEKISSLIRKEKEKKRYEIFDSGNLKIDLWISWMMFLNVWIPLRDFEELELPVIWHITAIFQTIAKEKARELEKIK